MHRNVHRFNGESSFGTWLYRIAVNQCLDFARSRAARAQKVTRPLADEGRDDPCGPLDQPIDRIDLERAIGRLPPGCREAFVLRDVEGFGYREMASLMGVAVGTTKSQVFKARAKLRAWLASRT